MIRKIKEHLGKLFNLDNRDKSWVGLGSNNSSEYNLRRLHQLGGGNTSFIVEMLHMYLENADRDVEHIRAACIEHNWQRVGLLAHKLIAGSRYLKIDNLVEHLRDLEISCSNPQDHNKLNRLVVQTCDTYQQARTSIAADLRRLEHKPEVIQQNN